jgi:hypothetical protein
VQVAAEVLLLLGERQDVIDCFLLRGLSAASEDVNAEAALRLLTAYCSKVVQLPPTLPELQLEGWEGGSYRLSLDDCEAFAAELEVRELQQQLSCTFLSQLFSAELYQLGK